MPRSVISFLALLLLTGTLFAQEPARGGKIIAGEREQRLVERYVGDVVIRTNGARIFILIDTGTVDGDAPDGTVDQWFTLEGDAPFPTPVMTHIAGAYVVHSPGTLRVSSPDRNGARFHFVVAGEATDRGAGAVQVTGVGLSHNLGDTNIRIADQFDRRGRVTTNCMDCEVLDPDPGGGGSSGSNACSSGGPGSTSCSVSSGSNSCSVACAAGYYACCYTLAGGYTHCRCAR